MTETETASPAASETDTPTTEPTTGAWPSFQFDARNTGFRSDGQTVTRSPTTAWTYHTGEAEISSSSVVGNNTVYIGSGSRHSEIYALDATTGAERWTIETDADSFRNSPAIVDDTVYLGTIDEKLYALDAGTGEQRWARDVGLGGASPKVVDDVLFASSSGTLHAFDSQTGARLWKHQHFGNGLTSSTPAVTDDAIYYIAGSEINQRRLVALDRSTRSPIWTIGDDRELQPMVAPTVGDGVVYASDYVSGPSVVAFDALSGEVVWEVDYFRAGVYASPANADGSLYVGSADDSLYAIDSRTGEQRWSFETGGAIVASPAVAAETVVFGSNDGGVYAVDITTGEQRWRFETEYRVRSSPAVGDGIVYVGSDDGNIYALGEQ